MELMEHLIVHMVVDLEHIVQLDLVNVQVVHVFIQIANHNQLVQQAVL